MLLNILPIVMFHRLIFPFFGLQSRSIALGSDSIQCLSFSCINPLHSSCVGGQLALLIRFFKFDQDLVENPFNIVWNRICQILNLWLAEMQSYFFENFQIECVPVGYLFADSVGWRIVMK